MKLLSLKFIKLIFVTICFSFLLPSCSSDNETDVSNNEKFRKRFSGTVWEWEDVFIKFSEDKLYFFKYGDSFDDNGCYYREEGSTAFVDFDGCVYDKITYVIINEDSENLTIRAVVDSGKPKDPSSICDGGSYLEVFQVESENTINFTEEGETITFLKSDEIFSSNSCSNALSSGSLYF